MITLTVNGEQLAPTMNTDQAAELLGCSTDVLYEGARSGTAPITPLRLGTRLRWPTVMLLAVLGIEPEHAEKAGAVTPAPPSSAVAKTSSAAIVPQGADRVPTVAP